MFPNGHLYLPPWPVARFVSVGNILHFFLSNFFLRFGKLLSLNITTLHQSYCRYWTSCNHWGNTSNSLIASVVKLFILFLNLTSISNDWQTYIFLGEAESVAGDSPLSLKNLSPRHQVFLELYQTEFNYVSTLNTIMTVSNIRVFCNATHAFDC